jgi:DNA invertase Pin-like site-specific DNA recombinase
MQMQKYVCLYARITDSDHERVQVLRATVQDRGDIVIAAYLDDVTITGRGKYTAWRELIANLDAVDEIIVSSAGDIPGRTILDLLRVLDTLRYHGVALCLHNALTGLTTGAGLDIVTKFRRAKLSEAIQVGQAKAIAKGKRLGRPAIPARITNQIKEALADGGGIRPTARRFGVSPSSVISIRSTVPVGVSG